MATTDQYIDTVWERLGKGLPQSQSKLWRVAVISTIPTALQRLADKVAGDDSSYPLLQNEWDLVLGSGGTAGQVPIHNLSPTLLISKGGRRRLRITMTGVRFSLKYRPHMIDLSNPPPIPDPDYFYYTLFQQNLVVRDNLGAVPSGTGIQLFGIKVPANLADAVFSGELFDDLCDIAAAVVMEGGVPAEAIRQAENVGSADLPPPGQPG